MNTKLLFLIALAIISHYISAQIIEVYSILGKQVLEESPNAFSSSLDMSALSSGVYLVAVTMDGISKTFKVVK